MKTAGKIRQFFCCVVAKGSNPSCCSTFKKPLTCCAASKVIMKFTSLCLSLQSGWDRINQKPKLTKNHFTNFVHRFIADKGKGNRLIVNYFLTFFILLVYLIDLQTYRDKIILHLFPKTFFHIKPLGTLFNKTTSFKQV